MQTFSNVLEFYRYLYSKHGPQEWWPCEGNKYANDEIAIGAILTQNTSWKNVEKALSNLKTHGILSLKEICKQDYSFLKELIKPAGFYNQKAERLRNFACYIVNNYGTLKNFFEREKHIDNLREELLSLKGIGKETADSILLYAGFLPIFVVDKYTYRLFRMYGLWKKEKFDYEGIREMVEKEIKDVKDLQEFHALIVKEGKELLNKGRSVKNDLTTKKSD